MLPFSPRNKICLCFVLLVGIGLGAFLFVNISGFSSFSKSAINIETQLDEHESYIKKKLEKEFLHKIVREFGYVATKHTIKRMSKRNISGKEMYDGIKKGKRYYDPMHNNYVFYNEKTTLCIIVNDDHNIITVFRSNVKSRWEEDSA